MAPFSKARATAALLVVIGGGGGRVAGRRRNDPGIAARKGGRMVSQFFRISARPMIIITNQSSVAARWSPEQDLRESFSDKATCAVCS